MAETTFQGRRAYSIENVSLRVTVLHGGGHIAEIFHKRAGVSPLWIPPWPSIEPGSFDPKSHPQFGAGADGRLLAGIMGHSLCLDIFGGPSAEEFAAGVGVHGESSVAHYEIETDGDGLRMSAELPLAGLTIDRTIHLAGENVRIRETVRNRCAFDRPMAWTQHVSLGPPFLEKGATEFRATATCSQTYEGAFGAHDYLRASAIFDWPMAPRMDGGMADLRVFSGTPASSAFTTHLMNPGQADASFVAFSRRCHLAFGYVWKQADFPWLGIWEENLSRSHSPWNGKTIARGMEFGASPVPETRRQMVERGRLFGVPCCHWLAAHGRRDVEYWALARIADQIPERLEWPGE